MENSAINSDTPPEQQRICVLGLGFVGLTLSAVLADLGFKVYGVDTNPEIIDTLKKRESFFFEDGLNTHINRHINNKLIPTTEIKDADASIYIISVGTPIDKKTGEPITKFISNAARSIAQLLKKGDLVILRSTVPLGLSRNLVAPILNESGLTVGEDYFLAFAPERTVEGHALVELRELPQIVGGYNQASGLKAEELFRQVALSVINVGSLEAAEMVKLLNNTYRDTVFGYANQLALICKEAGLDMVNLVKAANQGYPRNKIPLPSPGVGGACLSKDTYILKHSCRDLENKASLAIEARRVNELIPRRLVEEVCARLKALGKDAANAKIFIIGFAFKGEPETSDMRDSCTLDLLEHLQRQGAGRHNLYGYDFVVDPEVISGYEVAPAELAAGFDGADAVFIMNNHLAFRKLDIVALLSTAQADCVFMDGWRLFEPQEIKAINSVSYLSVGCSYG